MALKGAHHPSTLDRLHIRGGHAVGNGKRKNDWAVWAPISRCQNNGLFKSLASELAVSHQERKKLAVPLRTPSLCKGQKCQLSLPSGCLFATLGPWGPGAMLPGPSGSPGTCCLLKKAEHLHDRCCSRRGSGMGQGTQDLICFSKISLPGRVSPKEVRLGGQVTTMTAGGVGGSKKKARPRHSKRNGSHPGEQRLRDD